MLSRCGMSWAGWASAGLVVALTVAATGCASKPDAATRQVSLEERLERASRLLNQGQRDEANRELRALASELESLVRKDAGRPEPHFWLAAARYLQGDLPQAQRHFEAAANRQPAGSPGSASASYDLGLLHQSRKHHEAALHWFQRAATANPGDWRTIAKLVQVFQALGRTAERDRARAKLLDLHRSRAVEKAEFCREQFQEGRYSIMAFERFELAGEWSVRYRFVLADETSSRPERVVALGSYRVTTELARLDSVVGRGERILHLDGYGPGMEHQTFAFYQREPPYEEIRERVVEIARNTRQPISATIVSPGGVALSYLPDSAQPRIQTVALYIATNSDRDFVIDAFAALHRLAPSIAIDPANRIYVTGPVQDVDVGTVIVAVLAESKRIVQIARTPFENIARPAIPRDSANGRGTDAIVYFNPRLDPAIPTMTPDGRVVAQRGRPAFIGLGHELIHALHFINGTHAATVGAEGSLRARFGEHSFRTGSGAKISATEDLEELNTIGIGRYEKGITENALRRFYGLSTRGAYGLEHEEGK